ncbi:MAG: ankyrin repeat domain-containing protein [Gemmatimonadota bacterium]|nr:ankyrin repeat domain-containing protein [Gemmatimonadota bacterium]
MRNSLHVNVAGALALTALLFSAAPDSPVADAAQSGNVELVRELLVQGADVNAAQGDGMSALHWAASGGHVDMIEVLLYAGANTEAITRLGAYTPLHLAGRNGQGDAVATLVSGGANADATATTGVTPLHFAAAAGSATAVTALIEHGAFIDVAEWSKGQTPLMFAAAAGRIEAARALIEHGADHEVASNVVDFRERGQADGQDRRRRQELMVAYRKAQGEAEAETPAGDGPATQSNFRDPNRTFAEDRRGATAQQQAQAAQQRQQAPPAQARQGEGEDPPDEEEAAEAEAAEDESDEAESDEDALDAQPSDEEEEQRRAAASSDTPLGYNDLVGKQGGMTALHYAVRDGHTDVVAALLHAGTDVNTRTGGDQSTPLVIAAVNGRYDVAMYLLEQGADPNMVSEDGAGPLYGTIANRWAPKALFPQPTAFKQQETDYLEFMETLLTAGADPNARLDTHIWYSSFNFDLLGVNFRGASPFWRAAYAQDIPAMELLVAWGADPHTSTKKAPSRRFRPPDPDEEEKEDPSGLPPVEINGPGIPPLVAAAGVGYGRARAGNSHRHAPDSWLATAKYLIEVVGADPNARDHDGFSALHYAAARGDNELIEYLVSRGADPMVVARTGQTTVDMANGPIQRVQPFFETIELLEGMGAKNNNRCLSC